MALKITYRKEELEFDHQIPNEEFRPLSFDDFQSYEAFYTQVYQVTFQSLYSYGMNICGNSELVKDSIQELFSELWKNQKTLIKVKSVKPYLFTSLRRKIRREIGKRNKAVVEKSVEFELSHDMILINDQQEARKQQLLQSALKTLTTRQREAIYLRFYGKLSYDEVAQILKINTKATYKLVARALSTLKKAIISH